MVEADSVVDEDAAVVEADPVLEDAPYEDRLVVEADSVVDELATVVVTPVVVLEVVGL